MLRKDLAQGLVGEMENDLALLAGSRIDLRPQVAHGLDGLHDGGHLFLRLIIELPFLP